MEGIIKLLNEVDGQTLFLAGAFICIGLYIIFGGIVNIIKYRK